MQAYNSNAIWVCVALINIQVCNDLRYFKRRLDKHVWVCAVDSNTQTSWASLDLLITVFGVANNARWHLSKTFRTHITISQISVISAKINETTKAAP